MKLSPSLFKSSGASGSDGLFFGLIIFVGLVLAYIFNVNHTPTLLSAPAAISDLEKQTQAITLDLKVLDRITDSGLLVYGDIPIKPSSAGKDDLFAK